MERKKKSAPPVPTFSITAPDAEEATPLQIPAEASTTSAVSRPSSRGSQQSGVRSPETHATSSLPISAPENIPILFLTTANPIMEGMLEHAISYDDSPVAESSSHEHYSTFLNIPTSPQNPETKSLHSISSIRSTASSTLSHSLEAHGTVPLSPEGIQALCTLYETHPEHFPISDAPDRNDSTLKTFGKAAAQVAQESVLGTIQAPGQVAKSIISPGINAAKNVYKKTQSQSDTLRSLEENQEASETQSESYDIERIYADLEQSLTHEQWSKIASLLIRPPEKDTLAPHEIEQRQQTDIDQVKQWMRNSLENHQLREHASNALKSSPKKFAELFYGDGLPQSKMNAAQAAARAGRDVDSRALDTQEIREQLQAGKALICDRERPLYYGFIRPGTQTVSLTEKPGKLSSEKQTFSEEYQLPFIVESPNEELPLLLAGMRVDEKTVQKLIGKDGAPIVFDLRGRNFSQLRDKIVRDLTVEKAETHPKKGVMEEVDIHAPILMPFAQAVWDKPRAEKGFSDVNRLGSKGLEIFGELADRKSNGMFQFHSSDEKKPLADYLNEHLNDKKLQNGIAQLAMKHIADSAYLNPKGITENLGTFGKMAIIGGLCQWGNNDCFNASGNTPGEALSSWNYYIGYVFENLITSVGNVVNREKTARRDLETEMGRPLTKEDIYGENSQTASSLEQMKQRFDFHVLGKGEGRAASLIGGTKRATLLSSAVNLGTSFPVQLAFSVNPIATGWKVAAGYLSACFAGLSLPMDTRMGIIRYDAGINEQVQKQIVRPPDACGQDIKKYDQWRYDSAVRESQAGLGRQANTFAFAAETPFGGTIALPASFFTSMKPLFFAALDPADEAMNGTFLSILGYRTTNSSKQAELTVLGNMATNSDVNVTKKMTDAICGRTAPAIARFVDKSLTPLFYVTGLRKMNTFPPMHELTSVITHNPEEKTAQKIPEDAPRAPEPPKPAQTTNVSSPPRRGTANRAPNSR